MTDSGEVTLTDPATGGTVEVTVTLNDLRSARNALQAAVESLGTVAAGLADTLVHQTPLLADEDAKLVSDVFEYLVLLPAHEREQFRMFLHQALHGRGTTYLVLQARFNREKGRTEHRARQAMNIGPATKTQLNLED